MAGTRIRPKFSVQGVDWDRLRREVSTVDAPPLVELPPVGSAPHSAEEAPVPDRYLSKGGDPTLTKGHRRHIRRTEARRRARGD